MVMSDENVAMLWLWAEATGKGLEWTTTEGRTFQILGIKGATGLYERIFPQGDHPRRRNVSTGEMASQLKKSASQFELYRFEKGSGDFFTDGSAALKAAMQFFGAAA